MSDPDFKSLYLSIQRCNAAYIMDETEAKNAFENLGSTFLARLSTDQNQSVLHRPANGPVTLTNCGSRISEGSLKQHLSDLSTDAAAWSFDIGNGRLVAKAPFQRAAATYSWLFDQAPGAILNIEGHSLGGWESTYATEYINNVLINHICVWESPLQGNDAYWADLKERRLLDLFTQIYHGRDPWALWPWENEDLNKGPGPILWARDGTWSFVSKTDLPIAEFTDAYELFHSGDHGPTSVIDTFKLLANSFTLASA